MRGRQHVKWASRLVTKKDQSTNGGGALGWMRKSGWKGLHEEQFTSHRQTPLERFSVGRHHPNTRFDLSRVQPTRKFAPVAVHVGFDANFRSLLHSTRPYSLTDTHEAREGPTTPRAPGFAYLSWSSQSSRLVWRRCFFGVFLRARVARNLQTFRL
mgnify:CR=1 FL=1